MKAQAFIVFRVIFVCPKCQYENTLEPDGPTPKEAHCEHCGKHVKLEYESG